MKKYINVSTLITAGLTLVGLVAYKKLVSPTVTAALTKV